MWPVTMTSILGPRHVFDMAKTVNKLVHRLTITSTSQQL